MADILLAECEANVWLVGGEAHLDDLLANTLAPDVSIELVTCDSVPDVRALWARHGGDAAAGMPWLVHPAIVARVKAALRGTVPDQAVLFGRGPHCWTRPRWLSSRLRRRLPTGSPRPRSRWPTISTPPGHRRSPISPGCACS